MNSNIVLQKETIAFDGSGVQRSLAVSSWPASGLVCICAEETLKVQALLLDSIAGVDKTGRCNVSGSSQLRGWLHPSLFPLFPPSFIL